MRNSEPEDRPQYPKEKRDTETETETETERRTHQLKNEHDLKHEQ
jgi:hypothetical protein